MRAPGLPHRRARQAHRPVLLGVLCAAALWLLVPGVASAHAHLVQADPAPNSVIAHAPTVATFIFDEPLNPALTRVRITDASGRQVSTSTGHLAPGHSDEEWQLPLPALPPGTYSVFWTSESAADGHIMSSFYTFRVAPSGGPPRIGAVTGGAAGVYGGGGTTGPGTSLPGSLGATVIFSWLGLMAQVLWLGALVIELVVLSPARRAGGTPEACLAWTAARRLWWLVRGTLAVGVWALLAEVISLALQGTGGAWGRAVAPATLNGILSSQNGHLIQARLGVLLVALVVIGRVRAPAAAPSAALTQQPVRRAPQGLGITASTLLAPQWETARKALAFLAAVYMLLVAFSGHATNITPAWLSYPIDWLHLLFTAAWAGGIAALAYGVLPLRRHLPPGERAPAVLPLLDRFSPVAYLAAAVLALSGLYNAVNHVAAPSMVAGTTYGQLLVLKLGLVGLLIILSASHVWGLCPCIARAQDRASQDARAMASVHEGLATLAARLRLEAGVGAAILLVTALMGQTLPPARGPATPGGLQLGGTWVRTRLTAWTNALLDDPHQAGLLFAGTADGVRLSPDGGATWRRAGKGLSGTAVLALAATPANRTIIAGSADGAVYANTAAALGSGRWQRISPRLGPDHPILSVAVSPSDGRTVLAGTFGALYRGVKAGRGWTWRQVARTGDAAIASIAWAPWDAHLAFASVFGTWPPVLVSHDGGRTWRPDTAGLPPSLPSQALLTLATPTPQVLFSTMGGGVWQQSPGGRWHDVSAGLPGRHAMQLVAVPSNTGVLLYVGTMGNGVYAKQGTAPWRPLGDGLNGGDYTVLALAMTSGSHPALLAGTARGVFRYVPRLTPQAAVSSTVSGTVSGPWIAARGARTVIHALVRAPWGTLYAGTSQGIHASSDGGAVWRPFGRGFPSVEAWSVAALRSPQGDVELAAAGDGAVYRLVRGDTRWRRAHARIGSDAAYSLLALPQPGVVLAGSDRGIFRSSDGGRSWVLVAPTAGGAVVSFAGDPRNGAIYAGLAGVPHPLRVSVDGGRTWHIPSTPVPPPSVEALFVTSGHLYAGVMGAPGGRAVWVRGAAGFAPLAAGLPRDAHAMALAAMGGRLLMGTMSEGVYSKTPRGVWTRLGQGPGDGVITSLLVLSGAHPVVLAGTDSGIYRLQWP